MANSSNDPAVRSILTGIRDAAVGFIDFAVKASGEKQEMWRLYYDSDIGSTIEKSAQKAITVSVYKAVVKVFPSLKSNNKTAIAVSRSVLNVLDRSKLLYQLKHGRINETRYLDELTKRYSAMLVAIIHRGEEFLTASISTLLEQHANIPRTTTAEVLKLVFSKLELSEEQSQKIVSEGLRVIHRKVKEIDARVSKAIEPVRAFVEKHIVAPGKKVIVEVKQAVNRLFKK